MLMDCPPLLSFAALAVGALGRGCGPVCRLPAFSALAADVGHVGAVAANHFAAFLTGATRFFRIEFVRRTFLVGRLATLAGDLTLLVLVHRSETALCRLAFLLVAARACSAP